MQYLRVKENLRDDLGISLATVNNWIKTGVIPAPDMINYYSENIYNSIIKKIKTSSARLNGRANRSLMEQKYISFLGITDKERKELLVLLIEAFEVSGLSISEGVLALSICSLKSNSLISEDWLTHPQSKIENVLNQWINEHRENIAQIMDLFAAFSINNENDDLIGAFYQSIQNISQKSSLGSYYTPRELLTEISIQKRCSVLDPCCGSGGILLSVLDKGHDSSKVYAYDIDPLAVNICKVNFSLFFNEKDYQSEILVRDISIRDTGNLFSESLLPKYDYIITNPPWGSKFSKSKKDQLLQEYPELSTTEIFSISLNNSIDSLSDNGKLFIFLPHSILNVATHKNIRKKILSLNSKISINILGNAFQGVLSESILLSIDKDLLDKSIHVKDKKSNEYCIDKNSVLSPDFIIPATSTRIDNAILNKIYSINHTTLKEDATFALGIVTGNNKKYILHTNTDGSEPIYRGKDIQRYRYNQPECFIDFKPEIYQQVAPIKYFRHTKIVYRFISDKIICNLDKDKSLVLNSANLFIAYKYPMETIVCLFNSPVYSFIYQKKFHSKKVLKSHLQDFPLPILTNDFYAHFKEYHDLLKQGNMDTGNIEKLIVKIFELTEEEMTYIKGVLNGNT